MIGHIESFDDERQTGAIKCEDKFYEFHINEWTSDTLPQIGDDVDFVPEEDGSASNVGPVGAYIKDMRAVKSSKIAGALGLFPLTGAFGIHRIYLGFYGIALLQIIFTIVTGGFGVMWGFMEGFLLFGGQIVKDAKGRPLK